MKLDKLQKLAEDQWTPCQGCTEEDKHFWVNGYMNGYTAAQYDKDTWTWEEIRDQYCSDEFPVFGGPFTGAMTIWEWLEKYYETPKRKENPLKT